jgi:hypothetical protein
VFHIDVAKVDQDVAHVAMAILICFKCRFQIFHLFQTYATNVSSGHCKVDLDAVYICKCFKCFHMYIASGFI